MTIFKVACWFTGVCNRVLEPFGVMLCANVDYDPDNPDTEPRVRSFSFAERPKYIGNKVRMQHVDSEDYVLGEAGSSKTKES